jgi:hypothetical protein
MSWIRLWKDMPNDPKWRVIARRSGRSIAEVLSVFVHMMTNAEDGVLQNWNDEDVAAALDIDPEDVLAIREAMQCKVIDGDELTGWGKRQPKREDYSYQRVTAFRARQRDDMKRNETHCNADETQVKRNETQCNALKRPDTDTDTDTDKNINSADSKLSDAKRKRGSRLPEDWQPSANDVAYGTDLGLSTTDVALAAERMRRWAWSTASANAVKRNWSLAFRNWLDREVQSGNARAGPKPSESVPPLRLVTEDEADRIWAERHGANQ